MGRLREETLERIETYADRIIDVVDTLEAQRRPSRVIDQLFGSGTSAGSNAFEADEAMSPKDFAKCLGISVKELNESRFWLRLVARRGWVKPARLGPLLDETVQLRKMLGSMVVRTKRKLSATPRADMPTNTR